MNIDREIRSSVFPPLQPRIRREEQGRKKRGIYFAQHFGSSVHQKAIIFASTWRFFIAVFFKKLDILLLRLGSLSLYTIGFPNGWLQFTLELASRQLHILIGCLSIDSGILNVLIIFCFYLFSYEIECSDLNSRCRSSKTSLFPAPISERPVRLKALFGPEIWQW